jgi:Mitochondrial carrier protein
MLLLCNYVLTYILKFIDTIKTKSQTYASSSSGGRSLGAIGMFKLVLEQEGIKGFYGGVVWVMLGQAIIKSAAFASNTWALNLISSDSSSLNPSLTELILAACIAGFVTSYIVNPIERVKILMQADNTNQYSNDVDCFLKVLKKDGFSGLVLRGIDATLWREVPGYALYFVVYSLLKTSVLATILGGATPLVCGALAGSFSWIPVYPFDVIKS